MQANNQYETVGYAGDVRMLEDRGYAAVDKEMLHQWAEESTSTTYATLFYSDYDDWTVEKEKDNLLSINKDIRFEKIDNIQDFKDYLEKGRDRELHPIYTVDMINNGSSWKENIVEYLNDNVASSYTQAETARIVETIHNPIESLIKTIKEDPTQENNTTFTKAYEKIKEESHYNEAKVIGDESINVAGKFKTIVDESKEITKLGMSKFKEHESANRVKDGKNNTHRCLYGWHRES